MNVLRSKLWLIPAITVATVWLAWFQSTTPILEARRRVELSGRVDFDRLFDGITAEQVRQTHEQIVASPSRLPGLAGDLAASRYVEQQFRELGLEVLIQHFPVTVPVTKWCRVEVVSRESRVASRQEETGTPDSGPAKRDSGLSPISLHPFWPNHVRTCTTPPEGLVGQVVDIGTGSLQELDGKDVAGRIVLAEMTPGYHWLNAAKLGAAAVIFRPTTNGLNYTGKILKFPGDIPRFLGTGPVDQLVGKTVRIEARVDWELHEARNVVGVLRPETPSAEALFLLGFTDSWSVVPDLAPGSYEGCSATTLIEAARALADQREGLARTVIFVACSGRSLGIEGPRRLHDAVGLRGEFEANYALIKKRVARAKASHAAMEFAVEAVQQVDYWQLDRAVEARLWKRFGRSARQAFMSIVHELIDRHVFTVADRAGDAKIAWEQAGRSATGPAMEAQRHASRLLSRARQAAGADGAALKKNYRDVLDASECRDRLGGALADALAATEDELRVERDTLQLADLLRPFKKSYFFLLAPSTHGRRLRYQSPGELVRDFDRARDAVVTRWLEWKGTSRVADHESRVDSGLPPPDSGLRALDSGLWTLHPSHYLISTYASAGSWSTEIRNRGFPVQKIDRNELTHFFYQYNTALHAPVILAGVDLPMAYQTPLDTEVSFEDLADQTRLITALSAQVVAGDQPIQLAGQTSWTQRRWFSDFGGEVVTTGGSNSILPNRRVADTLVIVRSMNGRHVHMHRSRDGLFRFPAVERGPDTLIADAYTLDDRTGRITGARDLGLEGQRFPHTVTESRHYAEPETRVTLLLSRMAPTDIYRLMGANDQPVTLDVLDADFHGPLKEYSLVHEWEHGATVFAPPGARFYLRLKSYPHYRAYIREQLYLFDYDLQSNRGILMGRESHESRVTSHDSGNGTGPGASPRIQAPESSDAKLPDRARTTRDPRLATRDPPLGFVSGIQNRVIFQEADLALSLRALNRDRLQQQAESGLADAVNLDLADKADRLIESGLEALRRNHYTKAYRDLMQSTALSLRIYPYVRNAVADAVSGILLYMFLLVPFSLFSERLLIGAGDIRSRIAGTFVIFLAAFLAIRFTHPAYEHLSSPFIVLVGFVIFMLCLLILVFISGKFAERIAALRRAGGGAIEAESDISRTAAAAAAFGLGVNNMRKRKVRTAYTIATLVLVSFCLVCFTAPHPELMRRDLVIGPATADGVILRFERQNAGHLGAIRARYGDRARIVARLSRGLAWFANYTPPGGGPRATVIRGALWVQSQEARVTGIDKVLLPGGRWFERDDEEVCYISDITAGALGIDPARLVRGEEVEILLSGWPIRVAGIFKASALDAWSDLDGESNLPETEGRFTSRHRRIEKTRHAAGRPRRKQTSTSLTPGSKTVILPLNTAEERLCTSFALLFEDLPYGRMRETISDFMDGSATFISYALDGLAFFGGKFRFAGIDALVDVVVPLCIAAFIVFNTMLGSVYERQKEISVYSAVGLSPRHVFYLFLAESLVYAVIGVVGGYLLALVLQWIGHLSGDGLGLNINHSSRSAIYVTLTLMLAVLVSSFLPARRAARIASPSEGSSWTVPEATSPGVLDFRLPFTFIGRDIFGVIPFLVGWFDARGEDSSGEFSSSSPRIEVHHPEPRDSAPVFTVESTTWLRPYDLGVSQRVRISIEPADATEPGRFCTVSVRIQQLGGDEASWRRTNVRFIGLLRQHLLTWRALSARRKQQLFDQCRNHLRIAATLEAETASTASRPLPPEQGPG